MLERAGTGWLFVAVAVLLLVVTHDVRERAIAWRTPWTMLSEAEAAKAILLELDIIEAYASALEHRREDIWAALVNTEPYAREALRARLRWLTAEINRASGRRCCGTTGTCVNTRRRRGLDPCLRNPMAMECS